MPHKWDVWMSGYNDMGITSTAQRLNELPIEADSFDDAVRVISRNPQLGPFIHWNEQLHAWTLWACRLFPDERSARVLFG